MSNKSKIDPIDPELRAEFEEWCAKEQAKSPKVIYTNGGEVAQWTEKDMRSFELMDELEKLGWDINEHNKAKKEGRPYKGTILFWLKFKKWASLKFRN